jgi:hypothetical protein
LIALIIDAHRSAAAGSLRIFRSEKSTTFLRICEDQYIDRKTICFKHIRELCGQA